LAQEIDHIQRTRTFYNNLFASSDRLNTIGNICYYQMYGITYVRAKSTLDRKRVLKSKEFEKTRKYAGNFAIAARLASPVYKQLPLENRARWVYRSIAGEAASLLYQGKSEQEVNEILWEKYVYGKKEEKNDAVKDNQNNASSTKRVSAKSLKAVFLTRWELQGKYASDFKRAWKDPRSFDPESVRRLSNGLGYLNSLF
jgi:hypothetical protein